MTLTPFAASTTNVVEAAKGENDATFDRNRGQRLLDYLARYSLAEKFDGELCVDTAAVRERGLSIE